MILFSYIYLKRFETNFTIIFNISILKICNIFNLIMCTMIPIPLYILKLKLNFL